MSEADDHMTVAARPRATRAARRYFRTLALRDRLLAVAVSGSEGLLLGLLDREALAEVDRLFYVSRTEAVGGGRRRYTDDEWNERGLFAWEAALVHDHVAHGARVLVTGAGGGREVLALLREGYDAQGFEPHPLLVQAGDRLLTQHGYPGRLREMERDHVPQGHGPWDAVLVGWGSYMLMPGRERRTAFLRDLRGELNDDGVVLFSFWPRSGHSAAHVRRVAKTANVVRRLLRRPLVDKGDLLQPNFVHVTDEVEVRAEATAAGLRVVRYGEDPFGYAVARPPS